jgi:ABC-type sulfate/molybdate transport systems ATPase subunit
VVVSHDVEDAHRYADRVLELRDGRIVREAHTV